jgi:ATP-dependent Lhr-like helicase
VERNASPFHALDDATRTWFEETLGEPTPAQRRAWPLIQAGKSTLLVAPTGSGKTLAAFLSAIDRLLFSAEPDKKARCRVLYVSPLKALVLDVERNLAAPLAGIRHTADRLGIAHRTVEVGMRTSDTPAKERARFSRNPPDVLVTTPESLYLLLTSGAREALRSVETVIVDEIHALAGTKRGSHLFLSLERLEALRLSPKPLQRIGLSATQRPLEEIARLLGGFEVKGEASRPREVVIADARAERPIELTIEVPVEDMAGLTSSEAPGALRKGPGREPPRSIWTSIHPRLVELVRAHRTTMIFVNNRRLAERLANAINETAGEPLARAHHGSVAREERVDIEDALKNGRLPCIVATSSLELGLDIGSVDLVVQIEAPPSVAAGIQRIGRANHQVGGHPRGTIFPKHRGDLVACAEAVKRMRSGDVEETHYPRNPVDVLAQQIVATVASEERMEVGRLFDLVRGAAPFAELSVSSFEGVLDMLSGRYPSDEFAELRPRLTWDRDRNLLEPRTGAKRLAVVNAGVIPDRGLYGVFLADGDGKTSRRVGELDEEMVFEIREGEVFVLGASSWRIVEITHDRVLVVPAPGEPGKMPFWRGDRLGRSVELGRGIGELLRNVAMATDRVAMKRLVTQHHMDERAAKNLVAYVREQQKPPYVVPTDRELVVEHFRDAVGDFRVCVLSHYGARVHAPLAVCIGEKSRRDLGVATEAVWTDDGIVLRFPESDEPPSIEALLPSSVEVTELLVGALGRTALFASHFRECAARALLLPRRHPGRRSPLWAQRKKAADLLQVASRYGSFPILLETYRECLKDVFDVPALEGLVTEVESRKVRVTAIRTERPSPFSANLLFGYVGNFIYEADAPLAERRAAALAIDQSELRELLGQADLADLLDPHAVTEVERLALRLDHPPRHPDDLHDLLLFVGDQSEAELDGRLGARTPELLAPLFEARRIARVRIAGEKRVIAAEDAGRYRDALGMAAPPGVPAAFLEHVQAPLLDLVSRYARTHGPFSPSDFVARYGAPEASVIAALDVLLARGRLLRGEIHPARPGITFCDVDVLRAIKRRSLAALRKQVEPVGQLGYARFLAEWHGIGKSARGVEALRSAMERLEGAPLPLADLENDILPARVPAFSASDLDQLLASGEIAWRGIEPEIKGGGRIAFYSRARFAELAPRPTPATGSLTDRVRAVLADGGALFFDDLARRVGAFPHDVLAAVWELVWAGEVTNDTLQPLRSLEQGGEPDRKRGVRVSRVLPGSQGRWSLLRYDEATETARRTALVRSLLARHGVLVREALRAEGVPGGFSAIYEVLRAMEEAGRVRRGYFVDGLGAAQFAEPGAEELLRRLREPPPDDHGRILAATDPASPWGAALSWPEREGARPMRAPGAHVVVGGDGRLLAWLGPSDRSLLTFLDEDPRARERDAKVVAETLSLAASRGGRRVLAIARIDGLEPGRSELSTALTAAGFEARSMGYLKRATVASHRAEWVSPDPAASSGEDRAAPDEDPDAVHTSRPR